MNQFLNSPTAALLGIAACSLVLLIVGYLILGPRRARISLARRRPGVAVRPGHLASSTSATTALIDKILRRGNGAGAQIAALDQAGVKMRLQDFVLLVIVATVVAGAAGLLLAGPLLALGMAILVPIGTRIVLNVMAGRRRSAFADQLDDALQLIASNLRAGHSLLQALASVAQEAEEPTSEEFTRVINETRVGRELAQALQETASRMGSADFVWVTQAIAINRETGGNLAEVLDGVGETIRERNQIRRQVKALSAEGKLSAYVLMALPFGVVGFLSIANPAYIAKFTQSAMGYALLAAAVALLIIGAVWLRKVVTFRF